MKGLRHDSRRAIPSGLTSALPEIASIRRTLEQALFTGFLEWGYREVIPPLLEFRDVIAPGLDPALLDRAYTVVDRHTGRLMILRPDVTPQVARMAAQAAQAHGASLPWPLRLCYRATVFRHEEIHAGREREIVQVGGELIGWAGPEADAEPIAMAIEAMRRVEMSHWRIVLGHVGYLRGLLEASGVQAIARREITVAMAGRDRGLVESLLRRSGVPRDRRRILLSTLALVGGAEVLRRARRLIPAKGHRRSLAALKRLETVCEALRIAGLAGEVVIDLGETRGFEYYTGVVFEVFAERELLGGGGRYDELMGQFGRPTPATGLALDVERIHRALNNPRMAARNTTPAPAGPGMRMSRLDVLLCQAGPPLPTLARRLRERGRRVATCPALGQPVRALVAVARAHHANRLVIAGSPTAARLTVVDTRTGTRRVMTVEALLECL